MDLLQDSAQTEEVDLNDLVEKRPLTSPVPISSIRNRAATSAVLSGDTNNLVEKYRLLMQEGTEGNDATHNQVMDSVNASQKGKHMGALISLLGDSSIPLEQKRPYLNVVGNMPKADPVTTITTQSLEKGSTGEDLRGESARISLADTMGLLRKDQEDRQKLINGLMASLPEASATTVGEMAATEVMPFGRNFIAANVSSKLGELTGVPVGIGGWVKNFLMPGSAQDKIQSTLERIPADQRYEYSQKIIASIKDSASVFHSDNYYAQYKEAIALLDSPRQSNTEIWTSNMMTLMDAFWVGSEVKALMGAGKIAATADSFSKARRPGRAKEGVSDVPFEETIPGNFKLVDEPFNPFAARIGKEKKALPYTKTEDTSKRIELAAVVRRENPVSVYSVVEQTNPEAARALHKAIVEGGDETAQALTGMTREQAIINNVYPQVGTESGAVSYKVKQDVVDAVQNTGATRYTEAELVSATDTIKTDFRNATGLDVNDAMTTFREDGDHMIIDAHYGTSGGAFVTPEAAKAQAQYSLSKYGIRDDEIVVMKRSGMDYIPAEAGDVAAGDYMIKVSSKLPIGDEMVTSWNPLDVKRNWTDRLEVTGSDRFGSVSGWLFDPGSMLHPVITRSAAVATDQAVNLETILLKPIKDFRNVVSTFKADRRLMLDDYIKEANLKGLKQDAFDLTARGFKPEEIKALNQWKDIWDTHFYLENYDLIRTLKSQNFQLFENANTKLFGKTIQKNQNIGHVFDPSNSSVRTLSKADMDNLYNTGGSYVALRRPITVGGVEVEHMMVRNTPSEYMRGLRDTDMALNYRDGYFTVNYNKGSKFVDKIVTDSSGKEKRTSVAVASNTKDAEMFKNSQQQVSGERYTIREDVRGFTKDGDGYWDVTEASGRISQRVRGQPLNTASGMNQLGAGTYIEDPMESAVRAAKSLSGRTVSRPMLETAKARFIEQYGDMLPTNKIGGKDFPSSRSEIVDTNRHTSKRVADARTTYGYVRFLEQGYINSADVIFQGGMHLMADMFAKGGISTGEVLFNKAANVSLTHAAKSTVFNAYIVGSVPIRQWIVQAHQASRMLAYNPLGMVGTAERVAAFMGEVSGMGSGSRLAKDFTKFVEDSGMVAGVDRNSLVRGIGLSMADSSSSVKRAIGAVASFPQKMGFDLGEKANMLGHLASVHEKWTRRGIDLTNKTNRDLALAEARALSYDLNKAGEYTYTNGSASALLQFLQMPQKGIQQLSNRKIALGDKLRMAGLDLIMFGAPVGAISAIVTAAGGDGGDILPEKQEDRDLFVYGVTSTYMNALFSMMDDSGEKTRLDFSALAPTGLDGWAKMYHAMADGGPLAMLAASPAGQIMAVDGVNGQKRNGRIPQALITMGRYFNVFEEIDPLKPTEFKGVLNDVAKITSGWSAVDNALIMLETRKKQDRLGNTIDSSVTTPEIIGAFLGFGTLSTKELYEISMATSKDKKKHEEQVMSKYRDILSYYKTSLNEDNPDIARIQSVSSLLMRTFTDPADIKLVTKQWQMDMAGKEQGLLLQMMRATTLPDSEKTADRIRMMPIEESKKAILLQRLKDAQNVRAIPKGND